MSVSVAYASTVQATETLTASVPAISASANSVIHNGYNTSATLNSGTTPPVTTPVYFEKDLSSGTATIDLTALTGTNGSTVTLNGLKVQIFKVIAKTGNANPITLTEGASNGYELMGSAWTIALKAGEEFTYKGTDTSPDVGGSTKTIDLSGTGSQGVKIAIIAG